MEVPPVHQQVQPYAPQMPGASSYCICTTSIVDDPRWQPLSVVLQESSRSELTCMVLPGERPEPV
eukprot:4783091-Amphidinium_carterae.1